LRRSAADSDRHVGETAGGVQPRAGDEPEIEGGGSSRVAAGDGEKRQHTGLRAAGADPRQALLDEDPVQLVQAHNVRDRAQRHQVDEIGEIRFVAHRERAVGTQPRARRRKDIEHDAHARDVLARKRAAGLVRIDDDCGRRQRRAGKMMVGDQHV